MDKDILDEDPFAQYRDSGQNFNYLIRQIGTLVGAVFAALAVGGVIGAVVYFFLAGGN